MSVTKLSRVTKLLKTSSNQNMLDHSHSDTNLISINLRSLIKKKTKPVPTHETKPSKQQMLAIEIVLSKQAKQRLLSDPVTSSEFK